MARDISFLTESTQLQQVYQETIDSLTAQCPAESMLVTLLIERAAFLYIMIRVKEEADLRDIRVYKEITALWLTIIQELGRQTATTAAQERWLNETVTKLYDALNKAMTSLSPEQQTRVRGEFAELIETLA